MITVRAFSDNWIHMIEYEAGRALVVDPGECHDVLTALESQALDLTTILVTHHHADHVAGVPELKKKTACEVIGPDVSGIRGVDRCVRDGDRIEMGSVVFEVIATPGHTLSSVCYYAANVEGDGLVFTGDTLFVGGCGRLFEGSAEQMFQSLTRLTQLPDQTRVYCGHDYTEENLAFALTIEPGNAHIQKSLELAGHGSPTYSTIAKEKQSNVFVRAGSVQEFARRRKLKDSF